MKRNENFGKLQAGYLFPEVLAPSEPHFSTTALQCGHQACGCFQSLEFAA